MKKGANNPPNTFSKVALTNVDIIENNNWNEDYLSLWMLKSSLNDNNKYSQVLKLQLMRHKTNPIAISAVLDPTLILSFRKFRINCTKQLILRVKNLGSKSRMDE